MDSCLLVKVENKMNWIEGSSTPPRPDLRMPSSIKGAHEGITSKYVILVIVQVINQSLYSTMVVFRGNVTANMEVT